MNYVQKFSYSLTENIIFSHYKTQPVNTVSGNNRMEPMTAPYYYFFYYWWGGTKSLGTAATSDPICKMKNSQFSSCDLFRNAGYTSDNGRLVCEQWIGKDLEGSGRGPVEVLFRNFPAGSQKNIFSVQAEIRT
jgi:hypothetical protein